MQTLHFYTTGEAFNGLVLDNFQSGEFTVVESLVNTLDEDLVRQCFYLMYNFEGDTRDEEGMHVTFGAIPKDFPETLYFAIKTCMVGYKYDYFWDLEYLTTQPDKYPKIATLIKYISYESIIEICKDWILREEGYDFCKKPTGRVISGVILKDGRFIDCPDQDHINLMPILNRLKLVDAGQWTESRESIHISCNQLSGTIAFDLEHVLDYGNVPNITDAQIKTLWDLREWLEFYGTSSVSVENAIRGYVAQKYNKGGKYGNLMFVKEFYPQIKTPLVSDTILDGKSIVRTSPKYSIPGLLNSVVIESGQDITSVLTNMQAEFDKYKDILPHHENELHWFYQEFLEGTNGVAHSMFEHESRPTLFTHQLSDKQGDIVKGVKGNETLTFEQNNELRKITNTFAKDLNSSIQVEFVVVEEDIYVVQLRVLENQYEFTLLSKRPPTTFIDGITFSKGSIEVDVNDILVVDSEADSKALIGKKALIVKQDIEFSHILALSKALKIPSIYATGEIILPEKGTVMFKAFNRDGWVYTK